jgi:hypothetical protein
MEKPKKEPGIVESAIKLALTYALQLGALYLAVRVVILAIKHSIGG